MLTKCVTTVIKVAFFVPFAIFAFCAMVSIWLSLAVEDSYRKFGGKR